MQPSAFPPPCLLYTAHEDLAGAIGVNEDEIPGNGLDDDGNGYADDVNGWNFYHNNNQIYNGSEDSHGTHGAGTIRASSGNGVGISGMIPGDRVKLMPVKALGGGDGEGNTAALIKAIRYAEDNGASICNLSLTSPANDQADVYKRQGLEMVEPCAENGNQSSSLRFYGSSFITDGTGELVTSMDRDSEGVITASFDLDALAEDRLSWGLFRDRRPELDVYKRQERNRREPPFMKRWRRSRKREWSPLTCRATKEEEETRSWCRCV